MEPESAIQSVRAVMEWAAFGLEILAVSVILGGIVVAAFRHRLFRTIVSPTSPSAVSGFKHGLVSSLLLGLDLLVASDVIHTAALEPTLEGVATLGLLVVVRIALTWSLIVEAEGRWPWQSPSDAESRPAQR